jgi:hypothetical protein
MDREGKLFSAEVCLKEFEDYCIRTDFYNSKTIKRYPAFPDVATIKPK